MSVTRIVLLGALGRMGQATTALVATMPDVEIVCGVDITTAAAPFPIVKNLQNCTYEADIVLSFLPPTAEVQILEAVEYCKAHRLALVVCTTGLHASITGAANGIAIMHAPNTSLGVNLLANIVARAANILYESGFDIEIVEKHHNQKLDAPSGTAVMLANAVQNALADSTTLVYDRSKESAPRARNQIGMHAIRGGTIVGEHSVIFAGQDEIIEIKHAAMSRNIFATGAIRAAKFMHGRAPGVYTMQDVINNANH